ncbi:MAG TPA: hypothetical protein VGR96_12540 [Acidobacteriaceae bacterium]|nr:hypothetical protein [Acidobacteriaceae bacterium]
MADAGRLPARISYGGILWRDSLVKWLERLVVRRFPQLSLALAVLFIAAVSAVLWKKAVTLDQLSKAVDSILKGLAILLGALWSLNRYFTTRTDYPQLRVDMAVNFVPSTAFGKDSLYGLLSYRLDIVNTGKTLLPVTGYCVELANVILSQEAVAYEKFHRWPESGMHSANPIEPGSWGAISEAVACPKDVLAVNLYLDVELEGKRHWTWHRIIPAAPEPTQPGQSVLAAREPANS